MRKPEHILSSAHLLPTPNGIVLAGIILAKRNPNGTFAVQGREKEIHAQLQAAYGRAISPQAMRYVERGCELLAKISDKELEQAAYPFHPNPHGRTTSGNDFSDLTKGLMMFALTGLNDMENVPEGKERLLKMQGSIHHDSLLKSYGLPTWAQLTKDDGDDEDDDEDDAELDSASQGVDKDPETSSGSGHYNPDEPRIPAGQPGGGQWTTADGGGTASDRGSISADDVRNEPADTVTQVGTLEPVAYTATQTVPQSSSGSQQGTDGNNNSSSSNDDTDMDAAIAYLQDNAKATPGEACAAAVRAALNEGNFDVDPPNDGGHEYAKDYGPSLEDAGFLPVVSATNTNACNIYPPAGYMPQAGDVVVIQTYPGGNIAGHMAMYDGTEWISDFVQQDMWGGKGRRTYAPPYIIYRYPGIQ